MRTRWRGRGTRRASTQLPGVAATLKKCTVTFTPTPNFHGAANFTYLASDGTATSAPATVTVNVAAVNHAPVANADTLAGAGDAAGKYTAAGGRRNIKEMHGDVHADS